MAAKAPIRARTLFGVLSENRACDDQQIVHLLERPGSRLESRLQREPFVDHQMIVLPVARRNRSKAASRARSWSMMGQDGQAPLSGVGHVLSIGRSDLRGAMNLVRDCRFPRAARGRGCGARACPCFAASGE